MKTFEQLEQDVIAWADNLGIFEKSDPISQMLKTAAEVGELCDDINKGRIDEAKVELGDVLVTLILQCKMQGYSVSDCLELTAYSKVEEAQEFALSQSYVGQLKEYVLYFSSFCGEASEEILNDNLSADQIGGTFLFSTVVAHLMGSTATACLQLAYDKISNRVGKMENGVFIREGDEG